MKVTALILLDTLPDGAVIAPGALNNPTGRTITVRAGESAVTGKIAAFEETTTGHVKVTLDLPELAPRLTAMFGELPPVSIDQHSNLSECSQHSNLSECSQHPAHRGRHSG